MHRMHVRIKTFIVTLLWSCNVEGNKIVKKIKE